MKLKILLVPILTLGILVVLLLFAFRLGMSKISSLRRALNDADQSENVLKQKQDVLTYLDPEITAQAKMVAAALPEKNSALLALYQIKTLALTNSLTPANFKVGAEIKEKSLLAKAEVAFELEGELTKAISFLSSLKSVAPLMVIQQVDLNITPGQATATVHLATFWSAFPTTLPKVTEPIQELTDTEKEALVQILALTAPPFVQLSATPPVERDNPFR